MPAAMFPKVKVATSVLLFYTLFSLRDSWFPLIAPLVQVIVIACLSWWLGRRIANRFLLRSLLPRVSPTDKAVLVTGTS